MSEVSRRVRGLRLRRAGQVLTMLPLVILPSALENGVGALIASFRSSIPCPPMPLFYASLAASRQQQRQTQGRAVRYSFLVGLFHPLLRTGLSRRSLHRFHHRAEGSYGSPGKRRALETVSHADRQGGDSKGRVPLIARTRSSRRCDRGNGAGPERHICPLPTPWNILFANSVCGWKQNSRDRTSLSKAIVLRTPMVKTLVPVTALSNNSLLSARR